MKSQNQKKMIEVELRKTKTILLLWNKSQSVAHWNRWDSPKSDQFWMIWPGSHASFCDTRAGTCISWELCVKQCLIEMKLGSSDGINQFPVKWGTELCISDMIWRRCGSCFDREQSNSEFESCLNRLWVCFDMKSSSLLIVFWKSLV